MSESKAGAKSKTNGFPESLSQTLNNLLITNVQGLSTKAAPPKKDGAELCECQLQTINVDSKTHSLPRDTSTVDYPGELRKRTTPKE